MNVYESIVQGLNEAIEYKKGNKEVARVVVRSVVAPIPKIESEEIRNIRTSLNMTQRMFADIIGVSKKTVEAWEAGTNTPSGAARRMLSMLKADPQLPEKYNLVSK